MCKPGDSPVPKNPQNTGNRILGALFGIGFDSSMGHMQRKQANGRSMGKYVLFVAPSLYGASSYLRWGTLLLGTEGYRHRRSGFRLAHRLDPVPRLDPADFVGGLG